MLRNTKTRHSHPLDDAIIDFLGEHSWVEILDTKFWLKDFEVREITEARYFLDVVLTFSRVNVDSFNDEVCNYLLLWVQQVMDFENEYPLSKRTLVLHKDDGKDIEMVKCMLNSVCLDADAESVSFDLVYERSYIL